MGERDIFINCPFSTDYQEFFDAIVFTVIRSGFAPRSARENDDGGEVRFDKICRIIADCPYAIHDISTTDPDPVSGLPRFNMPFELGLFLGARKFGGPASRRKKSMILDREPNRYQIFLSDIAGHDIHAHEGRIDRLIGEIASWLRNETHVRFVPGGAAIAVEFHRFTIDLPVMAANQRLTREELTYLDIVGLASEWIRMESPER